MKRAKKALHKLHTYLGRLIQDVERKASGELKEALQKRLADLSLATDKISFCLGTSLKWSASAKVSPTNLMSLAARSV